MDDLFQSVWDEQLRYNQKIGKLCPERDSPGRWTEILLLGLICECEEVLREVRWKRHRGNVEHLPAASDNLSYELADITKYALSLWQVWSFDARSALLETARKSSVMDLRLKQEFAPLPPPGSQVLLVDLDQTLADFRYAIWSFALHRSETTEGNLIPRSLNTDVDLKIDYRRYQKLHEDFISEGSYLRLRPIQWACAAVRHAINNGAYAIAYTARPADKHPRLWLESWAWLNDNDIRVQQLHIGGDRRVQLMLDLAESECDVVLFDDNPEIIARALNSGLRCVVPKYPYNAHLWRTEGVYPADGKRGIVSFPWKSNASESAIPGNNNGDAGVILREEPGVR